MGNAIDIGFSLVLRETDYNIVLLLDIIFIITIDFILFMIIFSKHFRFFYNKKYCNNEHAHYWKYGKCKKYWSKF